MKKDITKHCKACEIKFNKKPKKQKTQEFQFPKDFPVSDNMRNLINNIRDPKK